MFADDIADFSTMAVCECTYGLVDLWTDLDVILRRTFSLCARLRAAKTSPSPTTRPRWAVVIPRATYRPRRLPDSYG